jgi:16S rRNA (guanine527-N7)-methyltransferase
MKNFKLILQNNLKDSNLSITDEQSELLLAFLDLIFKWNQTYNLTSIKDKEEMLYKHIIDSAVISPYLKGEIFIDVGTGPGLPGIPLAILNPDKKFYLLDSQTKRINFVRQVKRELNINNIIPCLGRCEEFRNSNKVVLFDGILSRAFASLHDMLNLCKSLATNHTLFFALKGQLQTDELNNVGPTHQIKEIIKLKVPDNLGQRHLIIIK